MISSLLKPTGGDVRLNGKSVLKHPQDIRTVLGVVPQEIALYEELTSYENLKFFGRVYGLNGKELEIKIQEPLETVGLRDRQKELIRTYSGGMKRRINIARSLCMIRKSSSWMNRPWALIRSPAIISLKPCGA